MVFLDHVFFKYLYICVSFPFSKCLVGFTCVDLQWNKTLKRKWVCYEVWEVMRRLCPEPPNSSSLAIPCGRHPPPDPPSSCTNTSRNSVASRNVKTFYGSCRGRHYYKSRPLLHQTVWPDNSCRGAAHLLCSRYWLWPYPPPTIKKQQKLCRNASDNHICGRV